MGDYTAFVEAGESLVKLFRAFMTPEPVSNPEQIGLCSPHSPENNQLTVSLFHVEEDMTNTQGGYYQASRDVQRMRPTYFGLRFLVTAHSKAPEQMREADSYRIIGAATQTVLDNPSLPPELLVGSLAESGAQPRLMIERLNYEQLMKIWNNTSVAYKLSIVCKIEGVAIVSKRERRVSRVGEFTVNGEQIQ
ncbi:MAG: DUF4255 domain-containing protein [Oscillospiraceae bacterium]|jgi:hypothetical protein|nr:DUF4255 domain-containing protein [Oscillospiraceae bacterium]